MSDIQDWLIRLSSRQKFVKLCWVPSHVGVAGNEAADKAAGEAVTDMEVSTVRIPYKDIYPIIKDKIRAVWREEWLETDRNKLREIKPDIAPWPSAYHKNRKTEVTLCRVRIGHTLKTHRYLMEKTDPPLCVHCDSIMTVKHSLLECPGTQQERRDYYGGGPLTLSDIVGNRDESDVRKLFRYMRSIGLTEI